MAYYIRVLLPDWEPRPLSDLLAHSADHGCTLRPESEDDTRHDDADWDGARLLCPRSTTPVQVEITLERGTGESLLREELDEFREELEDAEGTEENRRRVAGHLDRTTAIVAARPLPADDDTALGAAKSVIAYYARRPGVLTQADADALRRGLIALADLECGSRGGEDLEKDTLALRALGTIAG